MYSRATFVGAVVEMVSKTQHHSKYCTICECIRTYHSKSSPVVWSHAITVTSSEYVLLKTPQRTTVTITIRRG